MIINAATSTIETFGDIRSFKTSIDPRNLEYITTLLSSNLYSNPEQSFMREIVSNAWDAHVEAGNIDTPVIIKIEQDKVTIRDFGTGISPERFSEIYCNIGSSTKRESNDYIGGFGIGRFSALACSDTVSIISYYNGLAFHYIMIKEGNNITTNLVNTVTTEEKNGVEVSIHINNPRPYLDALSYLAFFPNIYIETKCYLENNLNNIKIKKYNKFAIATTSIKHKILLGNVLYPLDIDKCNQESKKLVELIGNKGFAFRFNIGELNITPNRESIIYTNDTIKVINDRIKEAKEELISIAKPYIEKDYDNLLEYCSVISGDLVFDYSTNKVLEVIGFTSNPRLSLYSFINEFNITYKGLQLTKYASAISRLLRAPLPKFKAYIDYDKIYSSKLPYRIADKNQFVFYRVKDSNKGILCNTNIRLTIALKLFLKEYYKEYSIFENFSLQEYKEHLKNKHQYTTDCLKDQADYIIEEIYNCIQTNFLHIDFDTYSNFIKFKTNLKNSKDSGVTKLVNNEEVILHQLCCGYTEKRKFSNLQDTIKYLKNCHCGCIVIPIKQIDHGYYNYINLRGFKVFGAKQKIVDILNNSNLSFIVDYEWVLHEDPKLKEIHNILNCCRQKVIFESPLSPYVEFFIKTLPESLQKEYNYILNIFRIFRSEFYTINTLMSDIPVIKESYVRSICEKLENNYKNYTYLLDDLDDIPRSLIPLAIIKNKTYRLGKEAYEKIKNNKFLKLIRK